MASWPAMKPVATALLLLLGLLSAGCGGGGEEDLTGAVAVPEGYVTFSGSGISFVHPAGWKVDQRTDADGAPTVQVTAPRADATPAPLIQLTVVPGGGGRFDSFVEQRRVVVERVNDGKLDSEGEVELQGARKALRTVSTLPAGQGTAPVEVKSAALEAVRGEDIVVLTAAEPQRDGSGLDVEAVVDSLRFVERA